MIDEFIIGKVCKYCGSYYSPEHTWKKQTNGDWVCKECQDKNLFESNIDKEIQKETTKKIRLFNLLRR